MKMHFVKQSVLLMLYFISLSTRAQLQEDTILYEPLKLSGPRIGMTYIGGEMGEYMIDNGIRNYISQFGWQFETRYFTTRTGFQGLIEFITLLGGFDTKDPVLSGTLLVGFRTPQGWEAGAGPNITSTRDHSFVMAFGYTAKTENVNIPLNLAIAPSSDVVKYTVLIGFNIRRK